MTIRPFLLLAVPALIGATAQATTFGQCLDTALEDKCLEVTAAAMVALKLARVPPEKHALVVRSLVSENEAEELAYIMEVKGVPPINVLQQASRCNLFFDACLDPILVENSHGKIRRPNTKSLPQVLGCRDKNFIRFIDACLHWDPELRLTPDEALCHEWIVEGLPAKVLLHH